MNSASLSTARDYLQSQQGHTINHLALHVCLWKLKNPERSYTGSGGTQNSRMLEIQPANVHREVRKMHKHPPSHQSAMTSHFQEPHACTKCPKGSRMTSGLPGTKAGILLAFLLPELPEQPHQWTLSFLFLSHHHDFTQKNVCAHVLV